MTIFSSFTVTYRDAAELTRLVSYFSTLVSQVPAGIRIDLITRPGATGPTSLLGGGSLDACVSVRFDTSKETPGILNGLMGFSVWSLTDEATSGLSSTI